MSRRPTHRASSQPPGASRHPRLHTRARARCRAQGCAGAAERLDQRVPRGQQRGRQAVGAHRGRDGGRGGGRAGAAGRRSSGACCCSPLCTRRRREQRHRWAPHIAPVLPRHLPPSLHQSCAGWTERYRDVITSLLTSHTRCSRVVWRQAASVLKEEGIELPPSTASGHSSSSDSVDADEDAAAGADGGAPGGSSSSSGRGSWLAGAVKVKEAGITFLATPEGGQKTGAWRGVRGWGCGLAGCMSPPALHRARRGAFQLRVQHPVPPTPHPPQASTPTSARTAR
jgi:hypothetical protein